MAYKTRTTSFIRLIFSSLIRNIDILILAILSLLVISVNVYLSFELKVMSSNALMDFLVKEGKFDSEILRNNLYRLICALALHYGLHSVLEFMKGVLETRAFRISAREATLETVGMEYNSYHGRGLGKNQDNITRASWAFSTACTTLLIEIPNCIIYGLYYTYRIFRLFRTAVALGFFGGIFLCALFAFFVNIFVNRNEAICTSLYRDTLTYLVNTLNNFDVVRAFGAEEKEVSRYDSALSTFTIRCEKYFTLKYILTFLQKSAFMVPHFIILYRYIMGHDIGLTFKNISTYNSSFMTYKSNFISLRDFIFSLSKRISELSPRLSITEPDENKCSNTPSFNKAISLRNAQLYAGDSLINKGINLDIYPGDKIAITGANGAGKSTFLKTLLRFQRTGGDVLLDGTPITAFTERSIRQLISYVPQDHHILNNTILYNLSYGQAKMDENEIYRLCDKFGLHEFFKALPNGYLTQTGENGKHLSGGQKQRINFMRAIIKGSPIIILDEPTSNLDRKSEVEMIDSIFNNCQDKTVLIIIHNLDLLKKFNKIYNFKKEGVEQYNSYEELKVNI